jgi:transposase InsO family protein
MRRGRPPLPERTRRVPQHSAPSRLRPGPGLIFHSDRGSRYTSRQLRELLAAHEIRQSLSRPRQCWDNAVLEAFYSTLKTELVQRYAWPTRAQARRAIFEFVEVFYNRQRLHSTLGYVSPAEYEGWATCRRAGSRPVASCDGGGLAAQEGRFQLPFRYQHYSCSMRTIVLMGCRWTFPDP